MEESAAEFASSLRDLTTNSKPLISMLTMLADEGREHAGKIVEAIEHYLRTSEQSIKLPSLYLIDSIVKNIGDPYVQLFTENIVRNFVLVFQEGDERVRTALFRLRQTWKEIFPERKLYALDLNTQAVDPNWPVCAAAPIHVNPKFFKKPPSELEIARGTESELKSLDQRQKQLDRIQEELRRKRDEIAHKSAAAAAVSKQPQQPQHQATATTTAAAAATTVAATAQPKSPLNCQPPPQQQQTQAVHVGQLNQSGKSATRGHAHTRTKKESHISRSITTLEKANENVDNKDGESKKSKRFRDRDKIKKETASEKAHNTTLIVGNSNNNNNNNTKEKGPLATTIGDPRRKDDDPRKVSSSKFRIPKKAPSSSPAAPRGGTDVLEEAKVWPDSGGVRGVSRRSSHTKRRSSPAPLTHPPVAAAHFTTDKEAATILTGDVDLRLLEPRAKRRKEETVSCAFPSSKEDTDFRIRPKGAVSYPGQATTASLRGSPREESGAMDVVSTMTTKTVTMPAAVAPAAAVAVVSAPVKPTPTTAALTATTGTDVLQGGHNINNNNASHHVRTSSSSSSRRDPRSKKRMSPPVSTISIESSGNAAVPGAGATSPNQENVHAPATEQNTTGNTLYAEQLVREAERLLRGPSASVSGAQVPLAGDVTSGFPPPTHKRKPDRVNLRLLNSLQWSPPAPEFGQILLDRQMRDIRFVDGVAVAIMEEAPPNLVRARLVCFRGNPRPVVINEHQYVMANVDGEDCEFTVNGNTHHVRFGAPLRELYIDGVPYSCQFDGRPIKVRSGDDVFVVALPPPCPTVCDKRPAGPELLGKLGLRPMPTLGPMPGHLGSAGLPGLPQGSTGGNATADNGPANSVRGVAGGWVRYQEEQPMSQAPPPPSVRSIPSLFPPPMPPNIGCPLPGPPNRFQGGPPPVSSGPMGAFHPHQQAAFGRPQLMPPPTGGPLDRISGGPLPPSSTAAPFAQQQQMNRPMNAQQATVPRGTGAGGVGQLDVSDLLSKLVEQGLISNASTSSNDANVSGSNNRDKDKNFAGSGDKAGSKMDQPSAKGDIPQLTFKQPALLKQRIGGAISALHEGVQCSACGQRFQQGDKSTSDKYAQHLDWHFRLKRRGREGLRKATSRKWFFAIPDWIEFEEVEDLDDRARNFFEEQQEVQQDSNSQDGSGAPQSSTQELPSVEVAKLPVGIVYSCEHCHESFEKYFCEDSEDWRLRNAILVEAKLFHPVCYEDYLKPVSKPVPAPVAVPDEESRQETSDGEKPSDAVGEPVDESGPDPTRTTSALDETSQQLPGLDFDPSVEAAAVAAAAAAAAAAANDLQEVTAVVDEAAKHEEGSSGSAKLIDEGEPLDAAHPHEDMEHHYNDDPDDAIRADEQSVVLVVVEELGEFGVDSTIDSTALDDNVEMSGKADNATTDGGNSSSPGPASLRDDSNDPKDIEPPKEEAKVIVKGSGGFVLKVKQDSVAVVSNAEQAQSSSGAESRTLNQPGTQGNADDDENSGSQDWRPPSPDPRFKNLPPLQKGSEMSGLCSIM